MSNHGMGYMLFLNNCLLQAILKKLCDKKEFDETIKMCIEQAKESIGKLESEMEENGK